MLDLSSGKPAPAVPGSVHKKTPTRATLWKFSLAHADNSRRVQPRPGRSHQPYLGDQAAAVWGDSIPSCHLPADDRYPRAAVYFIPALLPCFKGGHGLPDTRRIGPIRGTFRR